MSLVYEALFLAVSTAIIIWQIRGSKKIDKPKETEDGKFSIPKPEDEFMDDVEYDEIRNNEIIQNTENQRLPDPKGTPTIRP